MPMCSPFSLALDKTAATGIQLQNLNHIKCRGLYDFNFIPSKISAKFKFQHDNQFLMCPSIVPSQ